jgi:hypothetical protein
MRNFPGRTTAQAVTCLGRIVFVTAIGPTATAVALSPANQILLTWSSLGQGTQYHVQTSTNLPSWTAVTNTTATTVSLPFTGDKLRMYRLSAANAPPQSVSLEWSPEVTSADVAGYFLYYGDATRDYTIQVDVGSATNAVVTNLSAGTTYFFALTVYAVTGLQSDYSNEVVWQCPLGLGIQELP